MALLTNRNNAIEAARVTQVARGIEAILNDQAPAAISAPEPRERQVFYLLIVTSVVCAVGLFLKCRQRQKSGARLPWLLMATALGILTILFLPLLLYITALPWRSFRLFAPDLAVLAVVFVLLLALNAILAASIYLQIKRTDPINEST